MNSIDTLEVEQIRKDTHETLVLHPRQESKDRSRLLWRRWRI